MHSGDHIYADDPIPESIPLADGSRWVNVVTPEKSRPAVTLDRTAFYPTSGGQPHDTGLLGGVAVLDVIDDDARVLHVLASPLAPDTVAAGVVVAGVVDAGRRLDHRQQHTGQHVLSAAFDRLFNVRTVSFHMSADVSTIVPRIQEPVTSFEHSAVATENGIASVFGRSQTERVTNIIERAAHPDARESLREAAVGMGLL